MSRRPSAAGRAQKHTRVSPEEVPTAEVSGIIPSEGRREFPPCPRVGVGGIVIHGGRVLLVERGQPPLKGRWSIPGGLVEIGESLTAAVRRELREETGLSVEPIDIAGVFERIERARSSSGGPSRVRYHYVIVDYHCRLRRARGGEYPDPALHAASDVRQARWVAPDELGKYKLSREAQDVIREAFKRSSK